MTMRKRHYTVFLERVFLIASCVLILCGTHISYAFSLGKTFDSTNWQEIETIAPAFLVNWVKRGDLIIKTGELHFKFKFSEDFLRAGQENLEKFDFNGEGFLVNKDTGQMPDFIYGLPFPNLTSKDEKAGEKIMANMQYGLFRLGAFFQPFRLFYVGKEGPEREITVVTKSLYYQGRPGGALQNSENFLYQNVALVVSPMDMKGTVQLFWEYNDDRQSTCFTYTSMMRRISRATPNTRSNPFLGSDMCPDDELLWMGKNNRFTWKLLGEKEMLCGFSSADKIAATDLPDGTFKRVAPHLKLAHETSDQHGAAWAPVNVVWSTRPVWIVEGMPKDPEYNYRRHIFYVDKDTFMVWFKEVYDRSGQYWKGFFTVQSFQVSPSGRTNLFRPDYFIAVDEKTQHATIHFQLESAAGMQNIIYCPENLIGPEEFTPAAAQQLTK